MSTPDKAAQRAADRRVADAVALRERGRRRLTAATVAVTVGSLGVAGAVAAILPGSSAAASTGSSSSSSSSGDQGGLQAPGNAPTVVIGGAHGTSGAT